LLYHTIPNPSLPYGRTVGATRGRPGGDRRLFHGPGQNRRDTNLNLSPTVHQRDGILHLTENAPSVNGLVFYREKLSLTPGFEMSFTFRISGGPGVADGSDGSGGDGFAVVIQNAVPTAVPPLIGYIPYHLPGALAVEFDTWMNGNLGDPDGNHISVQRVPVKQVAAKPFAAFEHQRSIAWGTPPVNLADGQVHTVRIAYRNGVLQVFFDQMKEPVVVADTDLAGAVDAQGMGYLGFAAGTAAAFQRHEILSWSFKTTVGNSL
jgi:hypothetical protein